LDRSISFYTKHLGLRLTVGREIKQSNAEIAFFEDEEDTTIELTHWREKKILEGGNFDHIAFEVADVQSTAEAL